MTLFRKSQTANQWVTMLHALYGGSQNYAKTPYEVHAHLTEVCGIFGKHVFKRRDYKRAEEFLPKIFAWACALLSKIRPSSPDLEDIILRKFPNVCGYCLASPCSCWEAEKPTLDEEKLRAAYFHNSKSRRRTVNDFQLMFREIYLASWGISSPGQSADRILEPLFVRMIEELAELGESVRFHHLYPENFDNELADFIAWWFALISCIPTSNGKTLLAEDCLWRAYPGQCLDCQMIPCLCRPGPVRQLMSRPIPGQDHRFDALTSALNQAAYNEDIKQVKDGTIAATPPVACARLDVDKFKSVNDTYGHGAGDEALRHIASVIRLVVRERDRVYRVSGDEFGVLFLNFTEEEAAGAMRRVCSTLEQSVVRWVAQDSTAHEFIVKVSVGVAETSTPAEVLRAFEKADKAAYVSKTAGGGMVTMAKSIEGE